MSKPVIWIESKEFKDRTEFRVVVRKKYPKGLGRKGMYEDYLSHWEHYGNCGGRVDYVFIAYKKELSVIKKLFGYNDYRNQTRIAIMACDMLISNHKKSNEIPKVQVYER